MTHSFLGIGLFFFSFFPLVFLVCTFFLGKSTRFQLPLLPGYIVYFVLRRVNCHACTVFNLFILRYLRTPYTYVGKHGTTGRESPGHIRHFKRHERFILFLHTPYIAGTPARSVMVTVTYLSQEPDSHSCIGTEDPDT
jgi:hypothetical protein